jgi:hypothetical protein
MLRYNVFWAMGWVWKESQICEGGCRRKERGTKANHWAQQMDQHKARWGGVSTSGTGRRGACLEQPVVTAEAAPERAPATVVYPFPYGDLYSIPSKEVEPVFSGFGDMPSDCGCDDDLPLPHSGAGHAPSTGGWARLQDMVASGGGGPDPVEFPGSGSSKYPKQGPARGVPYAIIERQIMGF